MQLVGLLLYGRDKPGTIEFGDEIMEAGATAALDRVCRNHCRERNDRDCRRPRVLAQGLANANPSISGISISVTTTSIAVPEESVASACVAEGTATT